MNILAKLILVLPSVSAEGMFVDSNLIKRVQTCKPDKNDSTGGCSKSAQDKDRFCLAYTLIEGGKESGSKAWDLNVGQTWYGCTTKDYLEFIIKKAKPTIKGRYSEI